MPLSAEHLLHKCENLALKDDLLHKNLGIVPHVYTPLLKRKRWADPWYSLLSKSRLLTKLPVQCKTLSLKLRWTEIKEDGHPIVTSGLYR